MPKKVLILANSSSGLYDFRNELILELRKKYQVSVSVPVESSDKDKCSALEKIGCRILPTDLDRRGLNPFADGRLFLKYCGLLRSEKPDLVITYTIKPNIYGALACRISKKTCCVNITGLGTTFQKQGFLRQWVIWLYRTALKKVKVVFFENAANRQLFIDEKIVSAEKTELLSGAGVNLERYYLSPYPKEGPPRFLFIGRVMKEKGVEELFRAMQRLHEEGADCTLDILGSYEEDYADPIRRCEQQGWLRYHGYQQDVRPFIEKAHCFVLPSYHEGMANTNLECAAMGRPVITSDIPGCKEAVIDGQSGILCRVRDAESVYDAMSRFLQLSAAEKEAMGVAGRRHMEEIFDKRRVVAETVRHLEMK